MTLRSSQATIAQSDVISLDFGWALFGRAGDIAFALVVALSFLGVLTGALSQPLQSLKMTPPTFDLSRALFATCFPFDKLSGSLFTSACIVYAASCTGQKLPRAFAVLDANRDIPRHAGTILHASLTIALIFLGGDFRSLVRIAEVALLAFYFLTIDLREAQSFACRVRDKIPGSGCHA